MVKGAWPRILFASARLARRKGPSREFARTGCAEREEDEEANAVDHLAQSKLRSRSGPGKYPSDGGRSRALWCESLGKGGRWPKSGHLEPVGPSWFQSNG
eukprot:9570114-Alexandrium_andersonii.AAC.1